MTIGEKIKTIRTKKGLTQKQLGDLCGMADSAIRRYENGRANPKIETLQKISVALEVPIWELLDMSKQDALLAYGNDYYNQTPYKTDDISKIIKDDVLSENNLKRIIKAYKGMNSKGKYEAAKQIILLSKIPEYKREVE